MKPCSTLSPQLLLHLLSKTQSSFLQPWRTVCSPSKSQSLQLSLHRRRLFGVLQLFISLRGVEIGNPSSMEERVVDASVGGRPKMNLQRRTLPVSVERPHSPNVDAAVVKPQSPDIVVKPRSFNPFGEARPREEVLAEKGQDWNKIDEQLDSFKIKEIGAEESDRPGSAKKGFGRRGSPGEEKTERSWRKPEPAEGARPISADKPAESNNGNPVEK